VDFPSQKGEGRLFLRKKKKENKSLWLYVYILWIKEPLKKNADIRENEREYKRTLERRSSQNDLNTFAMHAPGLHFGDEYGPTDQGTLKEFCEEEMGFQCSVKSPKY